MNGYNSNYFNRSSMKNLRTSIQEMVLEYTMGNAPTAAERESARRNAERARARKSGQPDPVYTNTPHQAVGSEPRKDIPLSITQDTNTPTPTENRPETSGLLTQLRRIPDISTPTPTENRPETSGLLTQLRSAREQSFKPREELGSGPPSITKDPNTVKPVFNISPGQKAQAEANRKAIDLAREVDKNSTKPTFGVGTGSYGQPIITGGSYVNPNSPEGRLRDQGWTPGSDGKLTPPDPEKDEFGYLNTSTGKAAAMRDAKADTQRQYGALKDASRGLNDQQFDSMVSGYRKTGKIAVPPSINTGGRPTFMSPYGSKFRPSDGGGPLMGPPGLGAAVQATSGILAPSGVARGRPVTNRRPIPKPTTNPRMFER